MENIVKNLHIFIILFAAYKYYGEWEKFHQAKVALEERIPVLKGQIIKAERQQALLKEYLDNIEQAKEKIIAVQKEVKRLKEQLPVQVSDSENLELLRSIAKKINVKEIDIKPLSSDERGFYTAKKYQLQAQGTFLQFLVLLEKFGGAERILNVSTMDIKTDEKKTKGRFQIVDASMVLETYQYNQKFEGGIEDKKIN